MLHRSFAFVVVSIILAGTPQTVRAEDVSKKVRNACTSDAKRLCPNNKFGSSELRYCMEANGRKISRSCMQALEDDGIVPRGYFKG